MDMGCDYINLKGYCESPKNGGKETECFCSDCKKCFLYPQFELRTKLPYEKENSLEKEAKGN